MGGSRALALRASPSGCMRMDGRLPARLRAVAGAVPSCRVLADIGTDHGYVPAALLLAGRAERAVAADLRPGPLESAKRTARLCGVEDRIDFRLGDGLRVLAPGEADCAVVAGMGGETVAAILAAAPWAREGLTLILQPASRAELLRRWLPENGYAIRAERLAEDRGRLYPILTVSGGAMAPLTEAEAWGGARLEGDPLRGRYLEERAARLERAAGGLARSPAPEARAKRSAYERLARELRARARTP